jgi:hypothetical protein
MSSPRKRDIEDENDDLWLALEELKNILDEFFEDGPDIEIKQPRDTGH